MRLVIDLTRNGNNYELDETIDIDDVESSDTTTENQWLYPLLTCGLVIAIVVRPVSDVIKSAPPIIWLQNQVGSSLSASTSNTSTIANRLYAALSSKGYPVAKGDDETNIIYLRGGDSNGKPTGNRINEWSDTRFVLMFRNGEPYIAGAWKATVKPGLPAIRNPLGKYGAAFIEDGYYLAWRLGTHRGIFGRTERGLVQVAPVKFRRDVNRNGDVTGEPVQTGMIGLNQHSGSNSKNVNKTSYACLVGQSSDAHLNKFIPLLENDLRYKRNPQHMFGTSILSVGDL